MRKVLFLDVTGTLLKPKELIGEVYLRFAKDLRPNRTSQEIQMAFLRGFKTIPPPRYPVTGDGDLAEQKWWKKLVEYALGAELDQERFDEIFQYYARAKAWFVFPEVRSFLQQAQDFGFRLAIISNFDYRLHSILQEHGLSDYFEKIICSSDARARKPSPQIFNYALQSMKVDASQCYHIGDSQKNDIQPAKSCGIQAFLLDRPKTDLLDILKTLKREDF